MLINSSISFHIWLAFVIFFSFFCTNSVQAYTNSSAQLVIYTYDSLFLYGPNNVPWDFLGAFATFAGVPVSSIDLVLFPDANEILSAAQSAVADVNSTYPVPDILIGLDNVLQLTASQSLLVPYDSPNAVQLAPWLLSALDIAGEVHLIPFEYSIITLVANLPSLQTDGFPQNLVKLLNSTSFQLNSLIQNATYFLPQFVTENPSTSGPGLAFLLWTIATYGDPQKGITGLMGSGYDWRDFWKSNWNNQTQFKITNSWDDAWALFSSGTDSIINSYLTDAAYDYCANNKTDYTPILSYHNNLPYAWLNIEGLGITQVTSLNATRFDLAKKFVDWFIGIDCQSHIPLYQWAYPANVNITLPQCYYDSGSVRNVSHANQQLTTTQINDNINYWTSEVVSILAGPPVVPVPSPAPGGSSPTPSSTPVHSPSSGEVSFSGSMVALFLSIFGLFYLYSVE